MTSLGHRPLVLGIGGTASPGSSTEKALKVALRAAAQAGAEVQMFDGEALRALPHYPGQTPEERLPGRAFVAAARRARGIIIASPGYHGSISGLVKNAIDYLEETARDRRVYLDGVPVGLIATAYGWQATAGTLMTLRSIVHALRGWPTPLGAAINCAGGIFDGEECIDRGACEQLQLVGRQVVDFARSVRRAAEAAPAMVH
jgi:FMN reductase